MDCDLRSRLYRLSVHAHDDHSVATDAIETILDVEAKVERLLVWAEYAMCAMDAAQARMRRQEECQDRSVVLDLIDSALAVNPTGMQMRKEGE